MTNYAAKDVERAIEHSPGFEGWGDAEYFIDVNKALLDISGTPEYAEYVGGKPPEEGGGEDVHLVVLVGTQYFRKDGYYASHYGTDWDGDFYEVTPKEKVITVYEPK